MWIFKNAPNLVVTVPGNTANSGDHNGGIPVSIRALGDKNWNLSCFCLPALPQNPRAVLYTVGKVFSMRSQRHWNCEKRFSIHREIMETC